MARMTFAIFAISLFLATLSISGCHEGDSVTNIYQLSSPIDSNINPKGVASNHQVAVDDSGNATVVWQQEDGNSTQIFVSTRRDGTWTHPILISNNISPDGQNARAPKVAMDGNGNTIVVWQQSNGTHDQIFKSEYRGGNWLHPTGLTDNISPDTEAAVHPEVAMDNNGNAIIVWEQSDATKLQIFKSEYRNGGWTHPLDLDDNISSTGSAGGVFPQVAMDNNGNAIITWFGGPGPSSIFKSEYRGGNWNHPATSAENISPDGEAAEFPQVAMDDNGNAIIVWWQGDGAVDQVFMSEYRSGSWTFPNDLTDNISPDNTIVSSDVQVAMSNNGDAHIVWAQFGASSQSEVPPGIADLFMSQFRNGSWSHPTDLSQYSSYVGAWEGNMDPQIAMNSSGFSVVTWLENDSYEVYMLESAELLTVGFSRIYLKEFP